uniref:Uncharacterized protein n=1 Tax=Anguilla anguilla TaxID=7936 RepID=A0A0E9XRJ8_ANGAN
MPSTSVEDWLRIDGRERGIGHIRRRIKRYFQMRSRIYKSQWRWDNILQEWHLDRGNTSVPKKIVWFTWRLDKREI